MRRRIVILIAAALTLTSFANAIAAAFTKGQVIAVDQAQRTVTLEHEDIKNLDMSGMRMTFRVGPNVDMAKLFQGAKIEFTADNIGDEITVTNVK